MSLKDRKTRWLLVILYYIALFAGMWLPIGGLGIQLNQMVLGLRVDHLVHATVYIPCAFFVSLLLPRAGKCVWWIVAVTIAMVTEWVQYRLPYRSFDVNDLMANFLGVTLGWFVLLWLYRRGKLS